MYVVYRVKDIVRIPPSMFDLPLEEAARRVLEEDYLGYVHPELGIIIAIYDVKVSEYGRLIPGDAASYHESEFSVLAFKPLEKEVVEGIVVGAAQRAVAFINLGPVDGIVHISQIMDEEVEFDPQRVAFRGKKTGRILEKGDAVRARIIAVSIPTEPTRRPRIVLTMRQPFLGKIEWVEEEAKKLEEARRRAGG